MPYLNFNQFVNKIDLLEEANILIAALEFKVFTHLEKKQMTHLAFAKKAGVNNEGAEALLNALVSLGAIKKTGNKFSNTSESYKHFCELSPNYKRGTVFLRMENRDEWSKLVDIIRNGRKLTKVEDDDPDFREPFTHAMHERSQKYSKPLTKFITRKPVGKLIDIGSGPGTYSAEILKVDTSAQAFLIDRETSLEVAKNLIKNSPVAKRISFVKGDIFKVDFEKNTDTALYSNILHIYNSSENQKLIKKIHKSLKRGGRILIVDLFLHENRIKPYDAALFSLTMLMFTATGKTYTFKETEKILKKCGFGKFKRFELGEGSSVIEAVKI
ncbi:MAG: methyltransferase domain-containing protein [Nitrospinae bacterium]|nr:methyltransferase domain-containing protein [Nitrospinota bacterium]